MFTNLGVNYSKGVLFSKRFVYQTGPEKHDPVKTETSNVPKEDSKLSESKEAELSQKERVIKLLSAEMRKNMESFAKETKSKAFIGTAVEYTLQNTAEVELLMYFAKSPVLIHRLNVAWNSNKDIPVVMRDEINEILITDKDDFVRFYLAGGKYTSEKHLRVLAGDVSSDLRATVASNKNTPADVLAILLNDKVELVRSNAALRIKANEEVNVKKGSDILNQML
ncbi:MAG: hypothetical protein AAB373_01545 [Patescibacteria group bacterium]